MCRKFCLAKMQELNLSNSYADLIKKVKMTPTKDKIKESFRQSCKKYAKAGSNICPNVKKHDDNAPVIPRYEGPMSSVTNTKPVSIAPPAPIPATKRETYKMFTVGENAVATPPSTMSIYEIHHEDLRPYLSANMPSSRPPSRAPIINID